MILRDVLPAAVHSGDRAIRVTKRLNPMLDEVGLSLDGDLQLLFDGIAILHGLQVTPVSMTSAWLLELAESFQLHTSYKY